MALFGNLFGSANNEYLDPIVEKLELNYVNNYLKDAETNLSDLQVMYDRLVVAGKLNNKQVEKYSGIIADYTQKVNHLKEKNAKASYWT